MFYKVVAQVHIFCKSFSILILENEDFFSLYLHVVEHKRRKTVNIKIVKKKQFWNFNNSYLQTVIPLGNDSQ